MPKNIVVSSDGTNQEGGKGHDTNVYKLFRMVENRTENQISFYDRGLGTGLRIITGNVMGLGISKNILECYEFIFENYLVGDQIFLFGFSRGAATVRSLSGFIELFGILPKSRPELISQAWKIYKERDENKRQSRADEFMFNHHNLKATIKFLGVWDTVPALGFPIRKLDVFVNKIPRYRHKFHDFKLSPTVKHARHALAVDEERGLFKPALWDREALPNLTVKQVWFPGVHTDVGGGYEEQELSDVSLVWMASEAQQQGLLILPGDPVKLNPKADGKMHDSREGFSRFLCKKQVRSWDSATRGKPTLHQSILLRTLAQDNESKPYHTWVAEMDYDVEEWPQALRS